MQKRLGLIGAVALSVVVAVIAAVVVATLFDVDWSEPWQAALVVVVGIVILLEVLAWLRRRLDGPHRAGRPASTVGPAELPDGVRRTINAHLADGKPINAIAAYRQATGVSLVEAKRAVEDWPEA